MGEVIKREFKIDDIRNVEQRRIPLPGIPEFPGNSPSALGNIIGAPTEATIPVVTSERPTFLKAFLSNLPSALGAALSRQQTQGEGFGEGFAGGLGAGLQGIEEQRRTQFQQGLQQQQVGLQQRRDERADEFLKIQQEQLRVQQEREQRLAEQGEVPQSLEQLATRLVLMGRSDDARAVLDLRKSDRSINTLEGLAVERLQQGDIAGAQEILALKDRGKEPKEVVKEDPRTGEIIVGRIENGKFIETDRKKIKTARPSGGAASSQVPLSVRKDIANAKAVEDRLLSLSQMFEANPSMVGGITATGIGTLRGEGALGGDIRARLGKLSQPEANFRIAVAQTLNEEVNRLSGAAVSPAEFERLRAGLPNMSMSPVEFRAAIQSSIANIRRIRESIEQEFGQQRNTIDLINRLGEIIDAER